MDTLLSDYVNLQRLRSFKFQVQNTSRYWKAWPNFRHIKNVIFISILQDKILSLKKLFLKDLFELFDLSSDRNLYFHFDAVLTGFTKFVFPLNYFTNDELYTSLKRRNLKLEEFKN